MTNAEHPGDETERANESGDGDAEALQQQLFAAWAAVHPEGTRQQFDAEWTAMTNEAPPSDTTGEAPASWEQDPAVLKRRMFEEWRALRPGGTHEQFEAEWDAVTAARGV
jgi:hypothetical protein